MSIGDSPLTPGTGDSSSDSKSHSARSQRGKQKNTTFPDSVSIIEVSPRDGLQNESTTLALEEKIRLVEALSLAGLKHIETGSFVNPQRVPPMADSDELFSAINRAPGVTYSALVPNQRGLDRALAAGATEVAVFTAASETFSQRNIECSIAESFERFKPVVKNAHKAGLKVRGYVSCVVDCPYEGPIAIENVATVSGRLLEMGCYEIALGDTTGAGTPGSMGALLESLVQEIDPTLLALHCHNTYGQALANILTGLEFGIGTIDSSVAGLGGCPYAVGASGNVATEDVVYMLHGMGIETGLDLDQLIAAGQRCCTALHKPNHALVAQAFRAKGSSA
ncbi:MAG: hydroxymethylglutaryl-CoA lyase [Pseudomonadota bacterium]